MRDDDLMDEYVAHRAGTQMDGANPIVRVDQILRYPIQHALAWPDVAVDNPPFMGGELCQLTFVRAVSAPPFESYAESFAAALAAAMEKARRDGRTDELAILLRHQRGIYRAQTRNIHLRGREWRTT